LRNDDSIAKQALYSGHHNAAEKETDPGMPGKGIWSKKCGQRASGTAGERRKLQHKTQLDGVEWSVANAPLVYMR